MPDPASFADQWPVAALVVVLFLFNGRQAARARESCEKHAADARIACDERMKEEREACDRREATRDTQFIAALDRHSLAIERLGDRLARQ